MKAIRFPFDHLNLVINSFQPAGMDGKPAMVENTVGIIFEHFGKGNHRFQMTLKSHPTPFFQGFLNPNQIQVFPEFLQHILEDIADIQIQILIQLQPSLETWFLTRKEMIFILQKQIFTPLDHLFPFAGDFLSRPSLN